MPTTTTARHAHFLRKAVPIALLGVLTLTSVGCKRMGGLRARMAADEIAHSVEIQGTPVTIGRFTAVDVENPKGNVKVVALPRHEEAHISFRVQKENLMRWRSMRMKPAASGSPPKRDRPSSARVLRCTADRGR